MGRSELELKTILITGASRGIGAEVATREATWFITEVHRELALHLDFIGSASGGWPEWRKKGELLAWMKPKSRTRLRAA